ncbi:Cadherin EGF LAG seven-pass G-type receptor [Trichinella spiralis]|uniref:Cadherin EGF LAG seven-pass G-type receptor n=1 Tax=Trichinella spiralis TaxID=6334 RepID=A0ABR3KI05_TRISP
MKQSSLLTFLAILAIFHYANCTDSSKVCKNVPKKKNDSDEIAFAIVGKRKRLKCPLTEANGDQATDVCWWFTNENGTKMHNLNNNNDSIYVINSSFLTILWNRVTLNDTAFLCQSSDGRIWEFKFAIIDCNNATVCNHRGKCIEKHVGTPMHSVHCICSSSNYRGEYCEITKSPYPYFITIIFTCPIIGIVWLLLHGENPKMNTAYYDFKKIKGGRDKFFELEEFLKCSAIRSNHEN